MSSKKTGREDGSGADPIQQKKKGRQNKGTGTGSRNSSRHASPHISPDRNTNQKRNEEETEEPWTCKVCAKIYSNPDDKLLECQRCKEHYCIACLGKSVEEYNLLSTSDLMWFCVTCREKVEKNIVTDLKIEEKCKEMMKAFDHRLAEIETSLAKKCSRDDAREIVREELQKHDKEKLPEPDKSDGPPKVDDVLNEIKERESRAANIVIYGSAESEADEDASKLQEEINFVLEITDTCLAGVKRDDIEKVVRLGTYNEEKVRPLLVQFKSKESKTKLFRGIKNLKGIARMDKIRLVNDMTRAERESEKILHDRAKELRDASSGEFTYRVRGPPWARKVKEFPVTKD